MERKSLKKLSLSKETIRNLNDSDLKNVNGGTANRTQPNCVPSVDVCINTMDPPDYEYTVPTWKCYLTLC